MAEPTKKSDGINALAKMFTGKDREIIIRTNKCMTCDEDAKEFRDDLSRKEYTISGMCQNCQDTTFNPEEE